MLLGQVITGGVVSRITRTWNEHWLVLPQSSRAVQFTVVSPTGSGVPTGGTQVIVTFVS
jgi:hypothetical protein